jgi:archaellum component FlaC
MSSSRAIPQTSVGRLVSLAVDNPHYYSAPVSASSMPSLLPLSAAAAAAVGTTNKQDENDEQMMLWKNIANLFAKYDNLESAIQDQKDSTDRCTDEVYQEVQEVRADIERVQSDLTENNVLSKHIRKIRKYVGKKCEKLREDINYGTSCADEEIYAYIGTLRSEFDTRILNLQDENTRQAQEMSELNNTYYRDYELFIQRENHLMAKLDAALHMNENLNNRIKQFEDVMMRQMNIMNDQITTTRDELRNEMVQRDFALAGDMREEFAHLITKEVAFESKTSAQLVQTVNDELTDLVTRSNQYHSHRFFGMVEDINQIRENGETLKKCIGMVDAELSDVKETVEHLTDEVGQNTTDVSNVGEDLADFKEDMYRELDRDYYDLKDHVKRQISRHEKKYQHDAPPAVVDAQNTDAVQIIANEYAEEPENPQPNDDEHVIVIDENTFRSDGDDEDELRPQV